MLIEQIHPVTGVPRVSRRGLGAAIALVALCLPSLLFVALNRDVPHFGVLQDDGIYLTDAKALAEGSGYRILSLPAQPYETRYPPLYPLYLSLAWRAIPSFPANLPLALLLSWLSLPVALLLACLWCRRQSFPSAITWLVVALFAVNPYVLFFVANLGSEILFMVFLLGAILAIEWEDQQGWRNPLLAGVLAGAAYLTRTAGIALLPAAIAYFCWKRQSRRALWFVVGMLPAVLGWALWSRLHAAPGRDIVTLCYTNYLGYYLMNVGWDNIGQILWRNLGALLDALGSLVFPQMMEGWLAKLILWPLAGAMILGCIRMVRQGYAVFYCLLAGISVAMLLVWHYQPNQRFLLPLAPLLLAGFGFEMAYLAGLFRRAIAGRRRSRVIARALAFSLTTVLTVGLVLQICMNVGVLPQMAADDRANTRVYRTMYAWIAKNLPAGANILWQDDTALYLVTGRHSASYVVSPRQFEATGGDSGEAARFRKIEVYAREQHLGYILLARIGTRHNPEVLRAAASNPNLEAVHEEAGGILYRVR